MLKRIPANWILLAPGIVILLLAFVFPLGRLFIYSFYKTTSSGAIEPAFVLDQYIKFFTDTYYLEMLWRSVYVGVIVSAICLVLGYFLAYGIARTKPKYRIPLLMLIALPLLTSAVIRNFGWIIILSKKGILNEILIKLNIIHQPMELMYTVSGVIIALVHVMLPYMVLVLYAVIDGMDLNLEKAASNLGANKFKVWWYVTLPISKPGIVAGTLLVFSITLSYFITPSLVGGSQVKLMATEIEDQTIQLLNWPFASAMGVILLITMLIVTSLYKKALQSKYEGANT